MYAYNTNYRIPTKVLMPEQFIIKDRLGFITNVTLQTASHEAMLLRKNNDQIIELLKSFLKYAPHNSNNYNYIYLIY